MSNLHPDSTATVQAQIESKLQQGLAPEFMEVLNESHMHSVPPNSETHFKVIMAAADFEGQRKVARHQRVYGLLSEELAGPVHALALHLYSPEEWRQRGEASPESPNCMGGSKADNGQGA